MATQIPQRGSGGRKPPPRPGKQAPRQGKQSTFKAQKRRQQRLLALVGIVVVVAAVIVVIGVKAAGGGSSGSGLNARYAVSTTALDNVVGVTPAQMKQATNNIKLSTYPFPVSAAGLTSGGKPEVLYIGAEYCPYCAGERWALVMALSQFGHFSGLHSITSEPQDSVASVPTFSFYGSTYTSPYLTFTPVETKTVTGGNLQTPTSAQQALLTKYDGPPYVPAQDEFGIPFLDMGNKYIQDGINYDDSSMQHVSFASIASQLNGTGTGPTTKTAGEIAATAGVLVSHLCQLTGGKSLNGNLACTTFPTPISKAPSSAS